MANSDMIYVIRASADRAAAQLGWTVDAVLSYANESDQGLGKMLFAVYAADEASKSWPWWVFMTAPGWAPLDMVVYIASWGNPSTHDTDTVADSCDHRWAQPGRGWSGYALAEAIIDGARAVQMRT